MANYTTGEINEMLGDGISITPDFIQSLGITPGELVRGKPKWSEDDFPSIVSGIGDRMQALLTGEEPVRLEKKERKPRRSADQIAADKAAKKGAKTAATADDDWDEDLDGPRPTGAAATTEDDDDEL